ncbi:MAG TPA: SRPBCC family protein [Polyangiaceae bacterium]|nr:SRPBCC family protein [Polyangiaceae bacterium]
MASLERETWTQAPADEVWDAIRDVGALHTRLVPGFVIDTKLEPGARVVTFGNGKVVKEPIVTLDDARMRLVWTAQGGSLTHYNGVLRVFSERGGSRVVWTADFLPNEAEAALTGMLEEGLRVMKATLDGRSA